MSFDDHDGLTMSVQPARADVALHRVADGVAASYSAPAPGKESPNEDAAAVMAAGPGRGVLAVADGAGGHPAGQDAARIALDELASAVAESRPLEDVLRDAIMNGLERANDAITRLGVGAAATIAVAEIDAGWVRTYHVGDCMILLVGQRGKLKLQTVSHSPVGYAVEAGLLDEDDALHHEQRHVVSNVIGTAQMRIEVGPSLRLHAYDTLLLASDGLFDNLQVNEILATIRKGPLQEALASLVVESTGRMTSPQEGLPSKPDDLTAVLFRLGRRG